MRIILLSFLLLFINTTLFADCHSDAREMGDYYLYKCMAERDHYQVCQFGGMGYARITGSNGRCTAYHVHAYRLIRKNGNLSADRAYCTFHWEKKNWGNTLYYQCVGI